MRLQSVRFGAALLLVTLGAGSASAEIRRMEALGVVPAGEHAPEGRSLRQAALRAGLAEAVERAALAVSARAGAPPDPAAVAAALGDDPLAYTLRFRVLEDRGERPRLLVENPAVESEYVVLVEAHVDLDRVRSRLAQAGLLLRSSGGRRIRPVRVAVEGLATYRGYRVLRDALAAEATAVRPVEFASGWAVLEVETARSPAELFDALRAQLAGSLEVVALRTEKRALRLRVFERRAGAARGARRGGSAAAAPGAPHQGPTRPFGD